MAYKSVGILTDSTGRAIRGRAGDMPTAVFPRGVQRLEVVNVQRDTLSIDWAALRNDPDSTVADCVTTSAETVTVYRVYVNSVAVPDELHPEQSPDYASGRGSAAEPFRNLEYALRCVLCALRSACWPSCARFQILLTGTVNYTINANTASRGAYPGGIFVYLDDQSGQPWQSSAADKPYRDLTGVELNGVQIRRSGTTSGTLFSDCTGCVFRDCGMTYDGGAVAVCESDETVDADYLPRISNCTFYRWQTRLADGADVSGRICRLTSYVPAVQHIYTTAAIDLTRWGAFDGALPPTCYHIASSIEVTYSADLATASAPGSIRSAFIAAALFKECAFTLDGSVSNSGGSGTISGADITALDMSAGNIARQCTGTVRMIVSDTDSDTDCFRRYAYFGAFAFSGGAELYDCTAVCSVTGSTYLTSYFTAAGCSGITPQSLSATLNASGSITSGDYLQCQQSGSACSNWDQVEFNAAITYSDQSGDDYACRVTFGQRLTPPDGESYDELEEEICSALRPAETSLLSDLPEGLR